MRFLDITILAIVLCLFCPLYSGLLKNIREANSKIELAQKKADCLKFVSESFCKVGVDCAFGDFSEWANCCKLMWKLEKVEWERVDEANEAALTEGRAKERRVSESVLNEEGVREKGLTEGALYCGRWEGLYGRGEVYWRMKNK